MVLIGGRNFSRSASPTWCEALDRADVRNRIETLIGLLKGEHGLEDHGARSWWGLLTRLAGLLAAFTLVRYCLHFHLA